MVPRGSDEVTQCRAARRSVAKLSKETLLSLRL